MCRGYYISDGYMGLVGNSYMLFASECDYREYLEEELNDSKRADRCAAA